MIGDPVASVVGLAGAAWPVAVTMAVAVLREHHRAGRRRRVLNECLHELRRPLQALALASHRDSVPRPDSIELAMAALRDLDRELNGGKAEVHRRPVEGRMLAIAAVERWRAEAARAGRRIRVQWACDDAKADVDPLRVAQALDNLLANALEHGVGPITIEGRRVSGRLELAVACRARCAAEGAGGRRPASDPRHGHGLRVTRELARGNGGELRLRAGGDRTVATVTLPLAAR